MRCVPRDTVTIAAAQEHRHIVLTVADTGIGISSEDLPHIWERLYRSDKSRSQRGLGLGLSLVKAIIQAHEGTVEAFSEEGRGTRIVLALPVAASI